MQQALCLIMTTIDIISHFVILPILNNKFILDTSANYIIQNDKNMVSQGQYFNPLTSLYLFPRGEDFSDVTVYERYDDYRV